MVPQRGLVPAIAFSNGIIENEIITESGVVTQFLVDVRPSHLLPASQHDPLAPLKRARIAYFVDTWSSKVMPFMYATMKIQDVSEKEAKGTEWSETIGKEIEPLLEGASPFFGGSDKLTLAEVSILIFSNSLSNKFKGTHCAFCSSNVPLSRRQSAAEIPTHGL